MINVAALKQTNKHTHGEICEDVVVVNSKHKRY